MIHATKLYLPGLNGIRAIAAVGVLLSHINLSLPIFGITNYSLFGFRPNGATSSWNLGEQGVTMFFVLSGFLITYLLLLEIRKKKHVDKKKFYMRRILRIWPLYFFYLLLTILSVFGFTGSWPPLGTLSFYIFLLANVPFIVERTLPASDHLWSIAVEEQFYLFWPLLFKLRSNLLPILLWTVAGFTVLRLVLWALFPFKFFTVLITVNRFDCMVFGGILAILFYRQHKSLGLIMHPLAQSCAWLTIIIHVVNYEIINSIISMEFVMAATGFIICGQIGGKYKIINLEKRLPNFLGKYSFGIYVYHPLIIYVLSRLQLFSHVESQLLRIILIYVEIVSITILISYVSYEYFEKRFIMIKSKFSVVPSTNENTVKS